MRRSFHETEPLVSADAGITSRLFLVALGPARLHSALGMSAKYPTMVWGCLIHAFVATASLYLYAKSGPGGSTPADFPTGVLVFASPWPLWAVALWLTAPKRKGLATIIPILVGLIILLPVVGLALFSLLYPQGFKC